MDMSHPALSAYTFVQPLPARLYNSIRASVASVSQLEPVQVVCIIALGLLDFASLGVCGGEVQHGRAVRIWKLMIALSAVIVVGVAVWRFPFELLFSPGS